MVCNGIELGNSEYTNLMIKSIDTVKDQKISMAQWIGFMSADTV